MNGSSPDGLVAVDLTAGQQEPNPAMFGRPSPPVSSVLDGAVHGVRLLSADPELGSRLPADQLAQAQRHAILAAITLPPGRWELGQLRDHGAVRGEIRGFIVLSGALTTEVTIINRTCIRLLAPHELVLIDEASGSIPADWGWSVLRAARIAVLDERLLIIARHWPRLLDAILERAGQQSQHALLQQAISQLPRVEDRLLALLWSIADRWGVVRPDGVWIDLPLTHETIARMIGARRPTVSLGLRALADQDLLHTEKDGWLINHDSLNNISPHPQAEPHAAPQTSIRHRPGIRPGAAIGGI
jgi:CRP/FNR family transcriptional regulator, cyclic AMP receptor protein